MLWHSYIWELIGGRKGFPKVTVIFKSDRPRVEYIHFPPEDTLSVVSKWKPYGLKSRI